MIKEIVWGCVIVMFLTVGTAHAQYMKTEIAVAAGGGLHFPTGTLANTTENGVGGLVGADFFLNPSWTVGGRVSYAQFDAKPGAASYDELRFIAFDALGQLYLYPESWFTPYVSGGGGLAFEQRRSASMSDDHARFGLVGGFGLSAHQQASWWTAYSEVTYHHIMSDPGSAQFVSWNTGLRVSFGGRPF